MAAAMARARQEFRQGPVGMGTQGRYSPGSRGRPLGRCCRTGRAWALSVETPGRGKGCQENWKGGEGRGGFRRGEGQQGELALGTHWMWWAGPDVGSQGTPRWPEHPHPQQTLAVSAPEPGRPGGCPIPLCPPTVWALLWACGQHPQSCGAGSTCIPLDTGSEDCCWVLCPSIQVARTTTTAPTGPLPAPLCGPPADFSEVRSRSGPQTRHPVPTVPH